MKQVLRFFAGFLLIAATTLLAQTPQYFNYQNVGTSSNSFPFGQNAGKQVQWLMLPGDLNQPSPLPSGYMITKVYFYVSTAGTRTFNDLTIKMGHSNITTLPTGAWYTGQLDTVFHGTNVMLTGVANAWMSITLTEPFPYDPAQSLIIDVNQCGSSGTGISVRQNTLTNFRRSYSGTTTGCPFLFGGQEGNVVNFGVDVVAASSPGPNYLHYKFENNPAPLSVLNCAAPGVGTSVATMTGLTLTPGGQFDSCITGAGVTGSGVVTGWNNNLGSSSWTISFWADFPSTVFGYVFGDGGGSFRCFNNGAAPAGGITLRGTGITNVDVTGLSAGPMVIHFVYDSAQANIKVYKNGVLAQTVGQTPLNLTTGTGFKVGGYTTSAGFTGKMDEFRLYRRALDSTEVGATWNQDLACGVLVPVVINNNEVPKTYSLQQNYPNPFNPVTSIRFSLPRTDIVKLKVFDALGREVEVLVNEQVSAGTHEIKFDASKLSSGIYFYTIETPNFTETKKMMLIK